MSQEHSCLTCDGANKLHGLAITCKNCLVLSYLGCLPNNNETYEILNLLNLKGESATHISTKNAAYKSFQNQFSQTSLFTFRCRNCTIKGNTELLIMEEKRNTVEKTLADLNVKYQKVRDIAKDLKKGNKELKDEKGKKNEQIIQNQNELILMQQKITHIQQTTNNNDDISSMDTSSEDQNNRFVTFEEVQSLVESHNEIVNQKFAEIINEIRNNNVTEQELKRKKTNATQGTTNVN